MQREIERKFLLRSDSWRTSVERSVPMAQGYLASGPPTVRVRVAGEKGFLTIKGRSDGMGQDEYEYEIPLGDAEGLLALCAPRIEKVRHYVTSGKHIFEIDEFGGDNAGLVVLEVELESEDEEFEKPEYLGEEVTFDFRYKNSQLVELPYSRWGN